VVSSTDKNKRVFDVVMALIYAVAFLAVVQTLLRDVEQVLYLSQSSLQATLGLGQRLDL